MLVWIAVGLAVLVVIGGLAWRPRRDRHADLGFVTREWLSDHRLSQQNGPQS